MFFFVLLSVLTSCDSCVPRGKINFLSKSMSMSMTKSVQKIMLYNLRSMSSLSLSLLQTDYSPVTDPDLHIRGGGGVVERSSRPWDRGWGQASKKFFSALRASFWSKNKGGPAPPCSSPRSCNQTSTNGHVSTTATFLADSPYIDSCLNLSTMATFFCPQSGRWRGFNCTRSKVSYLP